MRSWGSARQTKPGRTASTATRTPLTMRIDSSFSGFTQYYVIRDPPGVSAGRPRFQRRGLLLGGLDIGINSVNHGLKSLGWVGSRPGRNGLSE